MSQIHEWLYNYGKDPVRDEWRRPRHDEVCFGVELELSHIEENPREDLADWACEKDGSLPETGGEFVSPPTPASQIREEIRRACQILLDCGGEVNKTCGAHIHISRGPFSEMAHGLVRRFLYDHVKLSESIFGRKANTYAGFEGGEYDKYTVQNLAHNNTVEYRLSAGSLDADEICLRIDFLECLYSLVAHIKTHERPLYAGIKYDAGCNDWGVNCSTPGGRTPGFCGLTIEEVLTRAKRDFPCLYERLKDSLGEEREEAPIVELPVLYRDPNQFTLELPCAAPSSTALPVE